MSSPKPPPQSTLRVLQVFLEQPDKYHWCQQIADSMGVNPGTVYPILRKLHDTGKVSRTKDHRDARIFHKLTPAGKAWAKRQMKFLDS